jgi:hypothetical protein
MHEAYAKKSPCHCSISKDNLMPILLNQKVAGNKLLQNFAITHLNNKRKTIQTPNTATHAAVASYGNLHMIGLRFKNQLNF